VMISGHGTIETAVEAIKIGAYDFIEKPFKADRLLLLVARAIEAAQLRRENAELRLRAGGELNLVGASPAVNQLRQQIERVAPTCRWKLRARSSVPCRSRPSSGWADRAGSRSTSASSPPRTAI